VGSGFRSYFIFHRNGVRRLAGPPPGFFIAIFLDFVLFYFCNDFSGAADSGRAIFDVGVDWD
jgi:hypothetical protein